MPDEQQDQKPAPKPEPEPETRPDPPPVPDFDVGIDRRGDERDREYRAERTPRRT